MTEIITTLSIDNWEVHLVRRDGSAEPFNCYVRLDRPDGISDHVVQYTDGAIAYYDPHYPIPDYVRSLVVAMFEYRRTIQPAIYNLLRLVDQDNKPYFSVSHYGMSERLRFSNFWDAYSYCMDDAYMLEIDSVVIQWS